MCHHWKYTMVIPFSAQLVPTYLKCLYMQHCKAVDALATILPVLSLLPLATYLKCAAGTWVYTPKVSLLEELREYRS